ncbi:putative tetratricopeptide-like helical domain superfamily [Helianthus annuus]|nr:putative tetratricopeptide-like helical domain superfamily [Helianthus annuus]
MLHMVLKHQIKTTHFLLSRALSTLLNPISFLDNHFSSLNNVSTIKNHEDHYSKSFDLPLVVQLQHNSHILNKLISSCASSRSLHLGIQVHSFVLKLGFSSNVYINTALVDMYGKCSAIYDAQKVFDEMPLRNVITWNSLMSGYLRARCMDVLIRLYVGMYMLGISPSHYTFSTVLVGCSELKAVGLGEQLHCLCIKLGFLSNVVVGTALLEMYWKCSNVDDSCRVFEDLPNKNVVTWTSMINGYTRNQQTDNAMRMIRKMMGLGRKVDRITYNTLLISFCDPKDMIHCEQIHCCVIKEGLESDMYLAVTLVTVYSQCGSSIEDFYKICSTVPIKNNISCNAIISGFVNLGNGDEALNLFMEMRQAGINIDFFTMASILKVIGVMSRLEEGTQIYALIIKSAHDSSMNIENGLISMYARCGKLNEAKRIFSSMVDHDTISLNSLLSGYAQHGYAKEAIETFDQMTTNKVKVKPDLTSFLIVISACSHVGWLDKGLECFELMKNESSLEPLKAEHYACIVDLYARAGYLNEAEEFINGMPIEGGPEVYRALLSGCRLHENKEIGVRLARKFVGHFPDDPAAYVLLSYILATDGYRDDSCGVHNLMCGKGIRKKPGCSWI